MAALPGRHAASAPVSRRCSPAVFSVHHPLYMPSQQQQQQQPGTLPAGTSAATREPARPCRQLSIATAAAAAASHSGANSHEQQKLQAEEKVEEQLVGAAHGHQEEGEEAEDLGLDALLADEEEEEDNGSEAADIATLVSETIGELPLPATRHQPALKGADRTARRAEAGALARAGRLVRSQLGGNGLTQAFLNSTADMLATHTLVRVKLGEGSGVERRVAARALEALLDCVAVHQVGFTVTLYRQPGLPRPSNCPASPSAVAAQAASAAATAAKPKRQVGKNGRKPSPLPPPPLDPAGRPIKAAKPNSASSNKARATKAAKQQRGSSGSSPPEFSVV